LNCDVLAQPDKERNTKGTIIFVMTVDSEGSMFLRVENLFFMFLPI
jgi:hypothetical protein